MKRGLLWSIVATLCGTVGSLFVTPVLVTRLGAVDFGLYILVLGLTSYASFFDFGLTWAAGRYLADDFANSRRRELAERFHTLAYFLTGVGLLSLVGAVLVGPAVLRAAGANAGTPAVLPLVLAATSFVLTLQIGLASTLLRACQRFDEAGRITALGSVLLPVGSYLAMRTAATLTLLLVVNALVNAIVLVLYLMMSRSELRSSEPVRRWDARYLREMASFGGWSMSNRALQVLVLQVDRLVVALLGSVAGLTYYAVPAGVASRVNSLGSALAGLFFSRASVLHASGHTTELHRQHAAATRFLVCTAAAAAAPLVLLGHEFLRVWIGTEMASSGGGVLMVLALGYAVIAVASLDAVTLEGCGRPDLTGLTVLTWSALATASVLLFAPMLGARAVAYAVAGWLTGVGLTDMVLARWVVLSRTPADHAGFPTFGLLASLAAATVVALIVRPLIDGLVAALLGLGAVGITTIGVGVFLILTASDRAMIRTHLADVVPALRMRFTAAGSSHLPVDQ